MFSGQILSRRRVAGLTPFVEGWNMRTSLFFASVLTFVWPPSMVLADAFFMGLGDLPGGVFDSMAFDISDDGSVTIGADRTSVRPETEFVPIKTNEELDMPKSEKVDGLIANAATNFTSDDKEFLMTLEDAHLDKLEPVFATAQIPDPAPVVETPPVVEPVVEEGDGGTAIAPITAEQYVADAPAEIADVLKRGMALEAASRNESIERIKANTSNTFTDEELKAFSTDQLDKMSSIATVKDYSGKGGPRTVVPIDPDAVPAMPKVFENVG